MSKTLFTKYGGNNSTIPDLRFFLICLLGFAGFLLIDELGETHKITKEPLRNCNLKIKKQIIMRRDTSFTFRE